MINLETLEITSGSIEDCMLMDEQLLNHNLLDIPGQSKDSFKQISFVVKKNNELLAGIHGTYVEGSLLYISSLFVKEELRSNGIGSLLVQKIENESIKHKVHTSYLSTISELAGMKFYPKLGYETFGTIEDVPVKGRSMYFLQKKLL